MYLLPVLIEAFICEELDATACMLNHGLFAVDFLAVFNVRLLTFESETTAINVKHLLFLQIRQAKGLSPALVSSSGYSMVSESLK